ncbi:MAG: hydrogenase maturation peptidase HycI [Sedimentisphaerales bacterium]
MANSKLPSAQTLSALLKQKLENAKRVAILGIGSELRGDDAAGILAAQQIEKTIKNKTKSPEVRVFIGDTAPENLTGEIKRYQPTHLIIIDSADLDIEPGEIRLINPEQIGGTSFCTHMLPTSVLTDYLLQSFKCEIVAIGIQPKTLTFGVKPSKEIQQAAKQLSAAIIESLKSAI